MSKGNWNLSRITTREAEKKEKKKYLVVRFKLKVVDNLRVSCCNGVKIVDS